MYLMSISTLLYVEISYSDHLDLHPNGQKHDLFSLDFFGLVEEIENWNMMRADKVMHHVRVLLKSFRTGLESPFAPSSGLST
jgi:hypothetical protein